MPVGRGRVKDARPAAPQQIPPVQQTSAAPDAMSGGRGVQRGGGRDLSTQMGQLSVVGRPDHRRREPYEKFVENIYKDNSKSSMGKIF